jgi:creatinine amidohydrolase
MLPIALFASAPNRLQAQPALSVQWEELTAGDFVHAVERAQGVCVLPFGILEEHGPHPPSGNDLINVRYAALRAAQQEDAVVYPDYYFGQIFEARHEPRTVAYSRHSQLELLQETADEMARSGCKKIILANGHGGINHLLPFFAQSEMSSRPLERRRLAAGPTMRTSLLQRCRRIRSVTNF